MYKASLIISFYKKIDFLKLVLQSLSHQTIKNFEIIISDDGSPEEIIRQVKDELEILGIDYQYCWHKDKGWRKDVILNNSVVASKSDLLVFIDGDCMLHPRFMEEHIKMAATGIVRAGRRVNLSRRITDRLVKYGLRKNYLGVPIVKDLLMDSIKGNARDVEQGIYVGNTRISTWLNEKDRALLGCNFSITKKDLLSVNGFDERFIHPAVGEDSDLEARLRRQGIRFRGIRNRAIQYHLYHQLLTRESENLDIFYENNEKGIRFTPYGIEKTRMS